MNSKMLFYILKRVLLALLTIWIVITVTFFVMHSIPGGPFASEKAISAEAQAALEAKYGLDKPLGEQYVTYLRDVVTKLDFGPSLKQRGRQVIDIILDGMKTSAKLGLIAAFSAAIAGIVLGALFLVFCIAAVVQSGLKGNQLPHGYFSKTKDVSTLNASRRKKAGKAANISSDLPKEN